MKKIFLAVLLTISILFANAKEWEQKVVLITGTASGIGKATAELLISEGHVVYGGDIQHDKNLYLEKIGGYSLKMDVTKEDEVKTAVEKIIKEQGRIDVLINNAGYGQYGPVEEVTMEDAFAQFDVNMFGVARVTKAVLPHMRNQKSGTIINISSMGGKIYTPLGAWYHATKHAIEGWSDCLRLEVAEFGINVVIIEPGLINTGFYDVFAEKLEPYTKNTAYGHIMEPMLKGDLPKMSEPNVVAKVINKAINKRKPKTRYVKGKMAKMAISYRGLFGDRAYDKMIQRSLR